MKILNLVFFIIAFVSVNKISAQEITTFPGFWGPIYYQDETQISKKQVGSLMSSNREADQLWKKSNRHMTIAWVALGAEIGLVFWQQNRRRNNEDQTWPTIGLIGVGSVALGFNLSSNNLKKKAILKYNANTNLAGLELGPTYNGMGLVLRF